MEPLRAYLTKNLEPIIWVWCGLSILASILAAIGIVRTSRAFQTFPGIDTLATVMNITVTSTAPVGAYVTMAAVVVGLGGITLTLVLTGLVFNLLDTRMFTKHTALSLNKMRQGERK